MFRRETEFKETSYGNYPLDWAVKPAKELFYIKGRIGWRGLKRAHFTKEGPYLITGIDFAGGKILWKNCVHIPKSKFLESPEIFVQKNDVLMTKDGTIGKVAYIHEVPGGQASINAHLFLIRTLQNAQVNSMYAYYALQTNHFQRYARLRQTGTTRAGFSQRAFEEFPLFFPSLAEQKRIADVLGVVDSVIEKTGEVMAKTERLKKGLMQELLTRGIGHTEYKQTPIGKTPENWDVRELGDESIADIIAGQSPPSSTYNKENRGLPFLQGKMEFGEIFPSPTTYCSEPIKTAKKDDVLLSIRAPVGEVNIAPFECCIGRGLAAIRANVNRLTHLFLFYYLKHAGKRFEALSTGSTFKAIRMQEIEKFSIPLPPLHEQQRITSILSEVDEKLELEKKGNIQLEKIKSGLMDLLLTGKVRIKVD